MHNNSLLESFRNIYAGTWELCVCYCTDILAIVIALGEICSNFELC